MMVCAHGNVTEFCEERDMFICETWSGDIKEYRGACRVLVTDSDISENEYYFLKGEMLARGIELISTRWKDDERLSQFLTYLNIRRKARAGGRLPFGYYRRGGEVFACPECMAVRARIKELSDAGMTLRAIRDDEGVHHPDGRKLSISTISNILRSKK